MKIRSVRVTVVDIPQIAPIAPYRSHIRSSSSTTSGIVEIATESGIAGLGEFNLNFLPGLDSAQMQKDAEWVLGRDARNIEDFHAESDDGTFTMIAQIQVDAGHDANQTRIDIEEIGAEIDLRAHLVHGDIFRATSEIAAVSRLVRPTSRRAV